MEGNYLSGVLEYREGPVVSSMVKGHHVPCVVDGLQTLVIGDKLANVKAHYDNVSGFSHQAIKLIRMVGQYG